MVLNTKWYWRKDYGTIFRRLIIRESEFWWFYKKTYQASFYFDNKEISTRCNDSIYWYWCEIKKLKKYLKIDILNELEEKRTKDTADNFLRYGGP
jgi:hypothetical protein